MATMAMGEQVEEGRPAAGMQPAFDAAKRKALRRFRPSRLLCSWLCGNSALFGQVNAVVAAMGEQVEEALPV
ncbi:MAG: hypothetical protein LBU47_01585, partial [Christensenellaceae bacterium]|nr:hypothetical protein [Christensenellaceae bacterium]